MKFKAGDYIYYHSPSRDTVPGRVLSVSETRLFIRGNFYADDNGGKNRWVSQSKCEKQESCPKADSGAKGQCLDCKHSTHRGRYIACAVGGLQDLDATCNIMEGVMFKRNSPVVNHAYRPK